MLYLLSENPARLLIVKHEDETGVGGIGQTVWRELESQLLNVTGEVIRDNSTELVASSMKPGQGLHDYFVERHPQWH